MENLKKSLFEFIDGSKSAYHTVSNVCRRLDECGYVRLSESDKWELADGGKYYVVRSGSSVIAFRNAGGPFAICASHSDFPGFKIKGDSTLGAYLKLDCEKYGGLINYTWLDRPLAIVGRAAVSDGDGVSMRLFELSGKRVVIPSVAIHLNRSVNESLKLNPASDLIPLAALGAREGELKLRIAENLGCGADDIISADIFLSSAEPPVSAGFNNELVIAPRLDDLACVFSSLEGFVTSGDASVTPVLAVFDNEEVGSDTKQGAASTFLFDTLGRICSDREDYLRRVAGSFMVSADNAHALHPNHPELADKANAPVLGGGVVIKHNANQKYATDAASEALFRSVCKKAEVKVQSYYNRADMPGGSTLGSISDTKVSLSTVDIGIPQLAMHSASEVCALSDVFDMVNALRTFYSCDIKIKDEKIGI